MTRLTVFFLLLLVLVVACVPVAPTEPPVIDPPTVTPRPGEPIPHVDLEPFTPVNKNHTLDGPPNTVQVGDPFVMVRVLAIPPLWSYAGETLRNIPPHFFNRDCDTEDDQACYEVLPDYVAGTFCLAEDNIPLEEKTRYIVKIRADKVDLSPVEGTEWVNGDVGVFARLWVTDGTNVTLREQPVAQRRSKAEWIWVIESDKRYPTVRLEACFRIQWASVTGIILLDDIEILTAPVDFGDDAVVGF